MVVVRVKPLGIAVLSMAVSRGVINVVLLLSSHKLSIADGSFMFAVEGSSS
jgi:hypothetical protein